MSHLDELLAIWNNNAGLKLLSSERQFEANQKLQKALSQSPFSPLIHLNLGLIFEKQGELDKALSEYRAAARLATEPDLRFAGRFNAAQVLGKQKKIGEALAEYQKALELNPQSLEAKTNIELLLRQGGGGQGKGENQEQKSEGSSDNKDNKQNKDDKQNKENKDNKDNKDDKDNPNKQDKDSQKPQQNGERGQNPSQPEQQKRPDKPKEFKSESMSQSDVRKILEELKNQEERIRRKEFDNKKQKENFGGKDW